MITKLPHLTGAHFEGLLAAGAPLDEVLALASEVLDLYGPPPSSGSAKTPCPACAPTVPSVKGELRDTEPATEREPNTIPVTEAA